MSILIFIIILAVLILIHEFGHFIVAKKSGVRVDEFGLGFPPKLYGKKIGETEYTINAIPFGGFVKIFGETPDDDSIGGVHSARSLVNKSKSIQALVISAGVIFNVLLAWLLISWGFMIGLPTSEDALPRGGILHNAEVTVTFVVPESPAELSGMHVGDKIREISFAGETKIVSTVDELQNFIELRDGDEITILAKRGTAEIAVAVTPQVGVVEDKVAIGVSLEKIGKAVLPVHLALFEGAILTGKLTYATAIGIAGFIKTLVIGQASFSDVLGPVGIVKTGIVGSAIDFGFVYILTLTALISINLAIINLVPFPALDGGRLLFLIVEAIKRSPINPRIANVANGVGFILLMVLMVLITYHDIVRPAIQ